MKVCLIYGLQEKKLDNKEIMLRITENEELAEIWIEKYKEGGGWENLRFEVWNVTDNESY